MMEWIKKVKAYGKEDDCCGVEIKEVLPEDENCCDEEAECCSQAGEDKEACC